MTADVSPAAGRPTDPGQLVDESKLVAAYYAERPDQRVLRLFGAYLIVDYRLPGHSRSRDVLSQFPPQARNVD
jgi:hypothetical protein